MTEREIDLSDVGLRRLAEAHGSLGPGMAGGSALSALFIALRDAARAEQRERDAKIAENDISQCGPTIPETGRVARRIAAAIRVQEVSRDQA